MVESQVFQGASSSQGEPLLHTLLLLVHHLIDYFIDLPLTNLSLPLAVHVMLLILHLLLLLAAGVMVGLHTHCRGLPENSAHSWTLDSQSCHPLAAYSKPSCRTAPEA